MSRRTEAVLIVDYPAIAARYPGDDARKLMCLVRRLLFLKEKIVSSDKPRESHHDSQEYAALHFVLEKLGVVRFEAGAAVGEEMKTEGES